MKRILSVFMILLIISSSFVFAEEIVTMYAPDGRMLDVYVSEIEAYKNVGWFENKSDVTKTMYAPDGRELDVFIAEIEAYKNVGWYENKSDVTKTMYAPDGRTIEIYISEIDAYKNVGWYENIEDISTVMCAPDGRKITVLNHEVEAYINVGWYPSQLDKIDPNKPMVALTFDDGPRSDVTGRVLNVLELYNAKATFFVLGNAAARNPQLLERMNNLGCQVGNHSYSHPNLASLSAYNIASQINSTSDVIYNAIGKYPTVVRPPYGSYNSSVLNTVNAPLILWSIDTLDWKHRNASRVINEVVSKVKDGDIVLMHDIYGSTATAVESIVPALRKKGFQMVTLDELAMYKDKTLSSHKTYSSIR